MRTDFTETETVAESGYDWRRDGWLAACAAAAALLVISTATPPAPGYDKFLRITVFCVALVRAFASFRRGGAWLPLSACVIAILFNPAAPIVMPRTASMCCDLIAAAWFAIAGTWRLLRGWQPQRGWAAAAVSLAALAVPAVAAMSMPNRDALSPAELDENVADMNAVGNAAPSAALTSQTSAAVDTSAPSSQSTKTTGTTPLAVDSKRTQMATDASGPTPTHSAPVKVVQAPPFPGNDAAQTDSDAPATAPVNNESGGNELIERDEPAASGPAASQR